MIQIDNEFKNLIPPLSTEEFQQLEENIIRDGCLHEIIVWNELIIDGHNRYQICTENNIPYKAKNWNFDSREDAKEWIIRNQFGRRNINDYQRSLLAVQLKDIISAKAKENQSIRKGSQPGATPKNSAELKPIETRQEIAKIAGVSHDTIHKVEKIETAAPSPIKEAAKNNVISINKAYEATKAINNMPEEKQQAVIHELTKPNAQVKQIVKETIQKEIDNIDRQNQLQQLVMRTMGKMISINPNQELCEAWLSDMDRDTIQDQIETIDLILKKLTVLKSYAQSLLTNPLKGVK